jgi:hypothetical protein
MFTFTCTCTWYRKSELLLLKFHIVNASLLYLLPLRRGRGDCDASIAPFAPCSTRRRPAAARGRPPGAMTSISVGIIGAGANTKLHHIPKLQAIAGVTVATVCNRSAESTAKVAQEFGIQGQASCWKDVINDPSIDAIVIGTWPYMHHPITMAALAAGKHVLTEARMAMDAAEAREMLAASRAAPSLVRPERWARERASAASSRPSPSSLTHVRTQVTQIVPSPMTLAWDATIRRLLRERALGQLLHVDVRGCSGAPLDASKPLHWRHSLEFSGCNIMSMGIFYEAIRRWVGDATQVMAMGQTFVKTRCDPQKGGCLETLRIPDHLDVIATLGCGAQLHMLISDVLVGACVLGLASDSLLPLRLPLPPSLPLHLSLSL